MYGETWEQWMRYLFNVNIPILQTTKGGKITVQTDRAPQTVHVYHATTLDGKR